MAWMFVRQPNGLWGRWSETVESFTHQNMSQAEALEVGRELLGAPAAAQKVATGLADVMPDGKRGDGAGDGLARWRYCIARMEQFNTGKAGVARRMGENPPPGSSAPTTRSG